MIKTLRRLFSKRIFKIVVSIFLILLGALYMYLFLLPRYLEKQISSNLHWDIRGSSDLEVVSYSILIRPNALPLMPFVLEIDAEIQNNGDAMIELLEINSQVTRQDGATAIRLDHAKEIQYPDTYYDTLPSEIGMIIPAGEKRPIRVWGGVLMDEYGPGRQFFLREKPTIYLGLKWFWDTFGFPLLGWNTLQTTLVTRPSEPSVAEWYQYWSDIPVKQVENPRQFWQACTFDLLAQIDPNPIFDDLVEKYGNKGIPNPSGPGRIMIDSDGGKIQLHTFRPKLQFVITFYDENGKFVWWDRSVAFEKDPYQTIVEDRYIKVGSNMPCNTKVKEFKVYLEVVP